MGSTRRIMHRPLLDLVDRMSDILPEGLDRLFFAYSGSEAIEPALRLARQATKRPNVLVYQGGVHGRIVGAVSRTTSGTKFRSGLTAIMGGVVIAPFPNATHYGWTHVETTAFVLRELDYILQTVTPPNETAAFFIEPVLGEGGYVPANTQFLRGLCASVRTSTGSCSLWTRSRRVTDDRQILGRRPLRGQTRHHHRQGIGFRVSASGDGCASRPHGQSLARRRRYFS